jgi:chromosome segregation ATPase
MYGASNLGLQTAACETLDVLTIQFDQFKSEAIANFGEIGKRLNDLRKHVDKIENCQTFLEERLMGLGAEQIQILRSITTLRKDIDQIGDRVTDADERLGILELDSEDEATDNAASSENGEQQCHKGKLAALRSGFDDLQKSFDVLRKRFEHSEDITLLLRTEVSHMKDRLGNSEEELADSESEGGSDSSGRAVSFHEQDHLLLSGNKVDWTEKDEKDLNDLLEKDWTTLNFLRTSPSQQQKVRILKDWKLRKMSCLW